MKQTALAVVASAAIGAATALFFAKDAPPMARSQPRIDTAGFQLAMERALESVGFGAQARSSQPAAAKAAVQEQGTSEVSGSEIRPTDGYVERERAQDLPPKNARAVDAVQPFEDDEGTRRTWLFRSERDVIAWLGTPDSVIYEGGGERWHYDTTDGDVLIAYFARGRLLDIER